MKIFVVCVICTMVMTMLVGRALGEVYGWWSLLLAIPVGWTIGKGTAVTILEIFREN